MQAANLPDKFQIPWANSAGPDFIQNPVPIPSQISVNPGEASFTDGFPPDTFISEEAGGFGPLGTQFNGILYMLSQWPIWQAAGFVPSFDAVWSALSTVGGYPKGARLNSSVTPGLTWLSLVDNNGNNPDVNPTGWLALDSGIALAGDVTGTPGANVIGNGRVTTNKIANNAVGLSQLFQAPSGTVLTNPSGGTANLQAQPFLSFLASLGLTGNIGSAGYFTIPINNGGTPVTLIFNYGLFSIGPAFAASQTVDFTQPFLADMLVPIVTVTNAATQMIGVSGVTLSQMTLEKGTANGGDTGFARAGWWGALGL